MTDFKKGDKVKHKTEKSFDMVIIGNCAYDNRTATMEQLGQEDPEILFCKYYNKYTSQWEEKCFYSSELELLS